MRTGATQLLDQVEQVQLEALHVGQVRTTCKLLLLINLNPNRKGGVSLVLTSFTVDRSHRPLHRPTQLAFL